MNPNPPALASPEQVEQLADQLSRCADALHERIMRDVRDGKLGLDPARTLFDDEVLLREHANTLYAEAAAHTVVGLGASQQHLLDLTRDAEQRIRKMALAGDVISLAASVLSLAGAAASGKPQGIIKALEGIYHATQALQKDGDAKP